jgi:pyruvate/2-oxoglutarate dehydrogenase complex dihydrolipoamide acyltransferase (E2) component
MTVDSDRARLAEIEKEISAAEKQARDFKVKYEETVDPQFKIGNHRSIWTADPVYFEPFLEAVKKLGALPPERRELLKRLSR